MLYLIGLGFDGKDISVKGLETAKKCEKLYCELYTSDWKGDIKELEEKIGKRIEILERSDLEENLDELLEKNKNIDFAIFVPGDPLVATTHSSVVLEAKKKGIETKVVHAPCIFSAIAVTGLQIYKFGKTATIPYTKQVENVKDTLEKNKSLGLHTLLLLDIKMSGEEGLKILIEKGVLKDEEVVVASHIGLEDEKIRFGHAEELVKESFPSPSVIIIPGSLHFAEKEYLEMFR